MIVQCKSKVYVRAMLAEPSIAARLIFEGRQPDYIESPLVNYWRVEGRAGVFMEVITRIDAREVHMMVPQSEVRHGRDMAALFLDKMFSRGQVQTVTAYVTCQSMVNFCLKLGFKVMLEGPSMTAMTLDRRVWVSAARSTDSGVTWALSGQQLV